MTSNVRTGQVAQSQNDLMALIAPGGARAKKPARRLLRWLGAVAAVAVVVAAGLALARSRADEAAPRYQTEAVSRGTLRVTVSATGNLQPINKVDVGSELSGLIETVLVDDNDHVTKGQVLARLDVSKLNDEITRSEAALAAAEAKEAQSNASVVESSAKLSRLREVSQLSGGKVPSKTEMETAEATLAKAQADVRSAKASVSESRAALSTAKTNLSKAFIRSPIDGVVLKRSVDPGQTVAASLQVATLFTIAEDLREMKLEVAVDEADVGGVKEGQQATFTVDAYPNRKYSARVTRVAYGSTTSNNVVSYTTTLGVKNDDSSLRPGMTATAEIATTTHENALLAPNAALRFTPDASSGQPRSGGMLGGLMPGPPPDPERQVKTDTQQVWVLRDGQPVAVPVTVGQSNGQHTEILTGDVREGTRVITETVSAVK
jgi:HlyD family secretion protein